MHLLLPASFSDVLGYPDGPWNIIGGFLDLGFCRYGGHPSLLGIELLNEPSAATVPLDILVSYYTRGYQIVRNHSTTAYVILCQRIGNADPIELFQAGIGLSNVVVDLHYYNLFDPYFASMNSTQNIEFIYKNRAPQLQALRDTNGPLLFIGMISNLLTLFLPCCVHFTNFREAAQTFGICSFLYCWSREFGMLRFTNSICIEHACLKTQFSVYLFQVYLIISIVISCISICTEHGAMPLYCSGEWVNEWDVQNASQYEYQKFGRAQLDVYANATFGWSYWTLKNDRMHWDFEWNIRNKYLLFSKSP